MISFVSDVTETRFVGPSSAEVVMTAHYLSIRIGGTGWRAGLSYQGPRSVTSAAQRISIRDYLLLTRLVSLAIVLVCFAIRRVNK